MTIVTGDEGKKNIASPAYEVINSFLPPQNRSERNGNYRCVQLTADKQPKAPLLLGQPSKSQLDLPLKARLSLSFLFTPVFLSLSPGRPTVYRLETVASRQHNFRKIFLIIEIRFKIKEIYRRFYLRFYERVCQKRKPPLFYISGNGKWAGNRK